MGHSNRTFVVGDIQGCLNPLKCLLDEVKFNPRLDTLWSVGDTVNRGPSSLKTLRFLYKMRDSLVMVLGNHDLHLLAAAAGVRPLSKSDTLEEILTAPDRDELLGWLVKQPLLHQEKGYTMVHAGIPPQWSVEQAAGYAREVEAVLQSERCIEFLQGMYGNEPLVWHEDLSGIPRWRTITNYFTRMRYCTEKGELDLTSKGVSPQAGVEQVGAWFSHPKRKAKDNKILFGHWASIEGRTDTPNAIALDTGCVWNGSLSFFQLETATWTQCRCDDGKKVGKVKTHKQAIGFAEAL